MLFSKPSLIFSFILTVEEGFKIIFYAWCKVNVDPVVSHHLFCWLLCHLSSLRALLGELLQGISQICDLILVLSLVFQTEAGPSYLL